VGKPLLPLCQGLHSSVQASCIADKPKSEVSMVALFQQQVFNGTKQKVGTSLILTKQEKGKPF